MKNLGTMRSDGLSFSMSKGVLITGRFRRTTGLLDQRNSHVSSRHHFVRKGLRRTRISRSVH